MFNSAHLVENIRCSHASATEPDLHGDYAGQEAAGTAGAEESFGNCGSQRPDTAAVLGAPREFEGVTDEVMEISGARAKSALQEHFFSVAVRFCVPDQSLPNWDTALAERTRMALGGCVPYIYIDKILNELRPELLSAMHAAVERELRDGKVDVKRLYRAFNRAAAGKCSNPVHISEKCVENFAGNVRKVRVEVTDD